MLPDAVAVSVVIVGAVAKPILSVPAAPLVNVPVPESEVLTVTVPLFTIPPVEVIAMLGEVNVNAPLVSVVPVPIVVVPATATPAPVVTAEVPERVKSPLIAVTDAGSEIVFTPLPL